MLNSNDEGVLGGGGRGRGSLSGRGRLKRRRKEGIPSSC